MPVPFRVRLRSNRGAKSHLRAGARMQRQTKEAARAKGSLGVNEQITDQTRCEKCAEVLSTNTRMVAGERAPSLTLLSSTALFLDLSVGVFSAPYEYCLSGGFAAALIHSLPGFVQRSEQLDLSSVYVLRDVLLPLGLPSLILPFLRILLCFARTGASSFPSHNSNCAYFLRAPMQTFYLLISKDRSCINNS
jgi:hypothetical protein